MSAVSVNSNDVFATASANNASHQSEAQQTLNSFWPKVIEEIRCMASNDLKTQELPLARIKKIMKLDEEVKMISAEAPVLFAKAAEIFVTELTLRAWIHTEDNKRRTLQRNDIAMAISKYDQFDFLIDIVPREELKTSKPREETVRTNALISETLGQATVAHTGIPIQLLQPNGQVVSVILPSTPVSVPEQNQTTQTIGTSVQVIPVSQAQQVLSPTTANNQAQAQIITIPQTSLSSQNSPVQILQQIMTSNGEVQQIPISQSQLQMIRTQVMGANSQPIIIQAATQPQLIQVASPGGSNTTQVLLSTPAGHNADIGQD